MPQFDLRGIKIAKYAHSGSTVTYSEGTSIGDAMNVDIQLKFAEGRLYAESTLAEYMKLATGGTISIGEKYIPDAAQKLMFGARENTKSVNTKTIKGLEFGANDEPANVGVAFYAPDMVDGALKYTCVMVCRALFGPPGMSFQTKGENIQFKTPTVSGEFMADHSSNKNLLITAVADTQADAEAWVKAMLDIT